MLTYILFCNQQDDHDGMKTLDDDNFIDDTGVDPADRYVSDRETASPSRFAQVHYQYWCIRCVSCTL